MLSTTTSLPSITAHRVLLADTASHPGLGGDPRLLVADRSVGPESVDGSHDVTVAGDGVASCLLVPHGVGEIHARARRQTPIAGPQQRS